MADEVFMMYCRNCDVIESFLSHCTAEIRFDTVKAREASFFLHDNDDNSSSKASQFNVSASPNRQL